MNALFDVRSAAVRRQILAMVEKRSMAEILPTHTPALFDAAVKRAEAALRAGELVALPTETVYGLAANALDARAVEGIFRVKGRPARNPVIVHVADVDMARRCTAAWPPLADRLARAFWPGPLTLVLPRSFEIPDVVTAGGATVGVRRPNHPLIQAVIRACGFPLAAPSANPSNQLSPTNPRHVARSLGDKIHLIVDGGQSQVGVESTVLDLSVTPPRILRPGMIHEESLMAVAGELVDLENVTTGAGRLRSPGLLPRHYAPRATLKILTWRDDQDLQRQLSASGHLPATIHVIAHTRIPSTPRVGQVSVIPHDPDAFARAIYAELHRCDEEGAELIVVESVPGAIEWRAVADRLARATGGER